MIKVGSDFSGVGAFNQALIRLGIDYHEVFACDMDKYARQTFIHNYGEPDYYPTNVYDRIIPTEPLDIYMTSPPCQSFSLAGKRLGKDDKRGILFFNSLEFIQSNKPRYFIFENVKGLLSDNGGKTFSEWVNLLGGKSVNGNAMMFSYNDAVPYHLHWQVLNAKHHGVPQNRERVFLVGIRDDNDNTFRFPIEEPLTKRLKDVLEDEVDKKYFLSERLLSYFADHKQIHKERGNGFKFEPHDENTKTSNAINTKCGSRPTDPFISIKSATSKGYDTACNQGVILDCYNNNIRKDGLCGTITQHCSRDGMTNGMKLIQDYKIRRLTPRECFRLMDFPDTFTWTCSDSQAYKQAGNSIVVNVLYKILKNLLGNNR